MTGDKILILIGNKWNELTAVVIETAVVVEAVEAVVTVEAVDAVVEAVVAVEVVEGVETVEAVEAVEGVEAVEAVEAVVGSQIFWLFKKYKFPFEMYIVFQKKKLKFTVESVVQNGGAGTVISQNWFNGHVPIVELGVVPPKHNANDVEFMHANRPSRLHVPHIGVQSTATEGLVQMPAVLLHAVSDGHVNVIPYAIPE